MIYIATDKDLVKFKLAPKESDKFTFGQWGKENKFLKRKFSNETGRREFVTPISAQIYYTMLRDIDPEFVKYMAFINRILRQPYHMYPGSDGCVELDSRDYFRKNYADIVNFTKQPTVNLRDDMFRRYFPEFVNIYNIFKNVDFQEVERTDLKDIERIVGLNDIDLTATKALASRYDSIRKEATRNAEIKDFMDNCISHDILIDGPSISEFQKKK